MDATGEAVDAIVDAVSRGRLTPADVAGLTEGELEALFALAQFRLERGQCDQAVMLFSALVALMPFRARFWRALGIGLHHNGAWHSARAAYRAALYLEPQHALTACWAAEVCLLLGDGAAAQRLIAQVRAGDDAAALARVTHLAGHVWAPVARKGPGADGAAQTPAHIDADVPNDGAFSLADGRTLPLMTSSFDGAKDGEAPQGADDCALADGSLPGESAAVEEPTATMVRSTQGEQGEAPTPTAAHVAGATVAAPMRQGPQTFGGVAREPTLTRSVVAPGGLDAVAARRRGVSLTQDITLGDDATAPDAPASTRHRRGAR